MIFYFVTHRDQSQVSGMMQRVLEKTNREGSYVSGAFLVNKDGNLSWVDDYADKTMSAHFTELEGSNPKERWGKVMGAASKCALLKMRAIANRISAGAGQEIGDVEKGIQILNRLKVKADAEDAEEAESVIHQAYYMVEGAFTTLFTAPHHSMRALNLTMGLKTDDPAAAILVVNIVI